MNRKKVTLISCILVGAVSMWIMTAKLVEMHMNWQLKRDLKTASMSTVNVPDELLENAVLSRLQEKYISYNQLSDVLIHMTKVERTVLCTSYFQRKAASGGLCSFLVEYPEMGPYILEALDTVGAKPYKELLEDFIEKNHINIKDMSQYEIADMYDYFTFYRLYPFQSFDRHYEELEKTEEQGMNDYITEYIYANMLSL